MEWAHFRHKKHLGECWMVGLGNRGRDGPRLTFIKKACKDLSMQTYVELKRTMRDAVEGCFTTSHTAEIIMIIYGAMRSE